MVWAPLYPEARRATRGAHVRLTQSAAALTARSNPWGTTARASWESFASELSRRGRKAAIIAQSRVVTVDFLLDAATFLSGADPVGALGAALGRAPGGRVELMSHPAYVDDAARGVAEVALLTAPRLRAMLEARGIRRVHYGQLIDGR